jgi:hypothetical protein
MVAATVAAAAVDESDDKIQIERPPPPLQTLYEL